VVISDPTRKTCRPKRSRSARLPLVTEINPPPPVRRRGACSRLRSVFAEHYPRVKWLGGGPGGAPATISASGTFSVEHVIRIDRDRIALVHQRDQPPTCASACGRAEHQPYVRTKSGTSVIAH